jgi:hypothetical protein
MERKAGDFLHHDAQGRSKGAVLPNRDFSAEAGAEDVGESSEEGDGFDFGGAASVKQF